MGEKWFALLSDRRAQTLDDTPRGQRALSATGPPPSRALRLPAQRRLPEPISANESKMRRIIIIIMIIVILIVVITVMINPGRGGISPK